MKKIPIIHIILFFLTLLSTLTVGAMQTGVDIIKEPEKITKGLPFAVTLMTILMSHELSHYFASKKHGVRATLPYFIPAPTIIGTFGAFIKMKSPIISRRSLIDIGASGPISGFIISVIATIIGLSMSEIVPSGKIKNGLNLGDSILFSLLSRIILGVLPADADIVLSPVAFAGWIGLFVTSMNLIPVGQLDGGHIAYAFMGEKHSDVSFLLVIIMFIFGMFLWEGWAIWAILLYLLGLRHPPVVYWEFPLDFKRRIIGIISFIIFIITFIPVPFKII